LRIGVVGLGRMGEIFAREFSKYYNVVFFDPRVRESKGLIRVRSLEKIVRQSDVVVIAVSLGKVPKVAEEIGEILRKDRIRGKVIFDAASLKKEVIRVYKKYPEDVKVAGVHPLFGPGVRELKGQKALIMQINDRREDVVIVKNYLRK